MQVTEAVIVVLEAAGRPMTIHELANECQPYVEELISYFTVKQVCLNLFQAQRVGLHDTEPLTFIWCENKSA